MSQQPLLSDFFFAKSIAYGRPCGKKKLVDEEDEESDGSTSFTPICRPLISKAFDWTDIPLQGDSCSSSFLTSSSQHKPSEQQTQGEGPAEPATTRTTQQTEFSASQQLYLSHYSIETVTEVNKVNLEEEDDDEQEQQDEQAARKQQRRLPTSPVSSMDCNLWDYDARAVAFAPLVSVHAFAVIVGDHPACELPMQLGDWQSTTLLPLRSEPITILRSMRPIPLCYDERLEVIQASTGQSEEELRRQEYEILTQV